MRLLSAIAVASWLVTAGVAGAAAAEPDHAEIRAQLDELIGSYPDRPPAETARRVRALVRDHPAAPAAVEARIWLGGEYRRAGRLAEAVSWYRQAQQTATDPQTRARAQRAEGDALLAGGQFAGARAAYRSLTRSGDPVHAAWADSGLAEVDRAERRVQLSRLAWIVVAVFVLLMLIAAWRTAGSVGAAARALARPPVELYYLAPIALVVGGISWRSNVLAAEAITVLFAGALVVTWLSGAALEAARRAAGRVTIARVAFHAVTAGAAVLAICYIALMRERVLDLVVEMWQRGPAR